MKSKVLAFSSQIITANKLYFSQPYLKYYSVYINYKLTSRTKTAYNVQWILANYTHPET